MQIKQWIPWSMVLVRATLGPVVLVGERCGWNGLALAAIVVTALLSDIFDGVLARRWKTDTAALRLSDSLADTTFYLCVAVAIAFSIPAVWHQYRSGFLLVLACEALHFTLDFIKFRKPASYHSYIAKTWGLVLAIAVVITFATQHATLWMIAAIALGVLSNAETFAMSLILPAWRRDVKTLAEAWRIRTDMLHPQTHIKPATHKLVVPALVLALGMILSPNMHAQSLQHVTYVGGTALQSNRINGSVLISATDTLVFAANPNLVIPYDHIVTYESSTRRQIHVGLLTEGIWRLLAPWPEAKQLSVTYRDANENTQVAVLEMSRADEKLLVEVLKAKVSRATPPPPVQPLHRPAGLRPKDAEY